MIEVFIGWFLSRGEREIAEMMSFIVTLLELMSTSQVGFCDITYTSMYMTVSRCMTNFLFSSQLCPFSFRFNSSHMKSVNIIHFEVLQVLMIHIANRMAWHSPPSVYISQVI